MRALFPANRSRQFFAILDDSLLRLFHINFLIVSIVGIEPTITALEGHRPTIGQYTL